jgi:hypothetical protein
VTCLTAFEGSACIYSKSRGSDGEVEVTMVKFERVIAKVKVVIVKVKFRSS